MQNVPQPLDEVERLDELRRYDILDTSAEEAFDALVRLAARVCRTPMAFINFLDSKRQWLKSRIGFEPQETPRETAFCTFTILRPQEPMIVPDARVDPRFRDNPLVVHEPHIRFYAGMPLVSPEGHALGTLSVLDREPRTLTQEQIDSLRLIADQVFSQLELRQRTAALREAARAREAMTKEAEEARRHLETILETVPDILLVLDADGRLRRWNRRAERVTGLEPDELEGRFARSLFLPQERAGVQESIERAMWDGAHEVEAHVVGQDGTGIPYWFTGRPLKNERGDTVGLTVIGRDVTQQKRAETALRKQRDRLERLTRRLEDANRELDAFAHSVSHDLRAPLRAIEFLSRVLLEDHTDAIGPEGRDIVQRQLAEEARMRRLIEDLLRLAQSSTSDLRLQPVDLSALAHDVVGELASREPSRRVEVHVQEGVAAEGDPALLRLVLENLIGNAWKYTSRQPAPRIDFGARRVEGDHLVCFVRDNGVGFDPAQIDRLFRPFQRLHGAEFEGTGVGLTIVQRVVRRHGGRVWAQGEPGKGATFYFSLTTPLPANGAAAREATGAG